MKLFFSLVLSVLPFFSWGEASPEKTALPRIRIPFAENKVPPFGTSKAAAWKNAAAIRLEKAADGMQKDPLWKNRETILLLTYDKQNLYFMILCKDEDDRPAGKKHDDELHRGDAVELFIDGTGDHRQYLEIQMNSRNLVRDVNYLFTGNTVELDRNGIVSDARNQWDVPGFDIPDFQHESTPLLSSDGTKTGWRIAGALPAKLLLRRTGQTQFSKGMILRANFVRLKQKDGKMHAIFWSPTIYGRPHRSPGRMGFLILN